MLPELIFSPVNFRQKNLQPVESQIIIYAKKQQQNPKTDDRIQECSFV